jgi:hypothetical protein
MNNRFRQVTVLLAILFMITINILANALPINGLNTGVISDQFKVYFVPAGYVFSIWGIIYIGLIAYAIYQALPAQQNNPRLQATGWMVVLGSLANSAWIFLWHYGQFIGTLSAMLILLASLITVYLRLGIGKTQVSKGEALAVRVPFSIYLGWITVATVANVTDVLDFIGWNRFGLAQETWMVIILGAVLVIALLMNFNRRDIAYTTVLLWALAGIAARFPSAGIVTTATWITFSLIALSLLVAFLIKRKKA